MRFEILSTPGYNTPRDAHGQHPTELLFCLHGEAGSLVWRLSTGIGPTGPCPSIDDSGPLCYGVNLSTPSGRSLTAHSELTERNADAEDYLIHDSCEYRGGRACVCDYSTGLTKKLIQAFACEGIPGVERELRSTYIEHYGVEE